METSKGAEDMVETTVTKTVAELKGIPTQEILLEQLRKETLVVTFNKLDGSKVTAEVFEPKTDKAPKEGNVTVWDINAKGWRSFKYDRITKVEDVQV